MWIKIPEGFPQYLVSDVTSFTLVWIKMRLCRHRGISVRVTSFTLVWIKIVAEAAREAKVSVTSFTLVWIKIYAGFFAYPKTYPSRASRSCGLK